MGWSLLLQGWARLEAKANEELAGLRYLLMGQKYVYTMRIEPCRVLVSIMLLLAACTYVVYVTKQWEHEYAAGVE